jgi:hypothetical protein
MPEAAMRIWAHLRETFRDHPLTVLFSQSAFARFAVRHPWAVHVWGVVFVALLLLILAAGIVVARKHLANQDLLRHGVDATATIADIAIEPYKSGRSNTQRYAVSATYHFTARDLRRYEGKSELSTGQWPHWRKGTQIVVLYDVRDATKNIWRASLEHHNGNTMEYIVCMPLLILYLLLCIYRYVRWWREQRGMTLQSSTATACPT